ncbi:MAG TPA: GAF domain-containing protein [Vicinamibacterales bacterium]|nr:GAF domain-containing protein [Vicinamibacterales bacterium]
MSTRRRAVTVVIWVLVAALAVIDVVAWAAGVYTLTPLLAAILAAAWLLVVVLALIATRRIGNLATALSITEDAHQATREQVAQLQMHNAMLEILARSVDVPLAFQALALRIAQLVPCDRVGLALLTENDEFQTYTARVTEEERRTRPRPEVVFKADRTAIGTAVRSREPMIINDTAQAAPDYLDVNVLHTSGFGSGLLLPLVTKGRAVGTLNVVARRKGVFTRRHIETLMPVTEIFAVAYVAQQLQLAMTRHRTLQSVTDLTLGISAEINSALQAIVGHCELIERSTRDPELRRDVAGIVRQSERITALLEKMRSASNERLSEVADTVRQRIPSSPEGFGEKT